MTWKNLRTLGNVACCALLVQVAAGADAPAPKPPSPVELSAVTSQVQSGDSAQLDAAIAKIKLWQEQRVAPSSDMIKTWLPALLRAGRNLEVADICLNEIVLTPSVGNVRDFFPLRITALQQMGRNDEALQAAKSLYNGCDMKVIDKVIPVVANALVLANPEDAGIGRRFTLEQSQSTARGSLAAAQPGTAATQPAAAILKSVKIDPKIYAKALADWKKKSEGLIADKEKYANLLLVADQGKEGEQLFHEMVIAGAGDAKRYKAGIPRALKTEDGDLTRATAAANGADDNALP